MKIPYRLSIFVMVVAFVSGCGDQNDPPKTPPPSKSQPQGTVFDGMISQKDRARKGAEDGMQKSQERLEQSMKQNERTDQPE